MAIDNEAATSAFEDLFGIGSETEEETTEEETTEEETTEEETTEEETTDEEGSDEEGSDEEGSDEEGSEGEKTNKEDKAKRKQNYAFGELRTANAKYEKFTKGLGKALGLDKNADTEAVMDRVNELMLNKQAKEQGVPLEVLQEIQSLRDLVQENQTIKLEKQVTESFTKLAHKYGLDDEGLNAFAAHLSEINCNPLLDEGVDVEAEYIKLHFNDIIQDSVDKAVQAERDRKTKIEQHGSTGVAGSKGEQNPVKSTINSVRELDAYFNGLQKG